jgi:nitroreductase
MIRDLVTANRSYRGFDPSRKVTREELTEFVECARLTPSGANRQPLRYYLAWEKEQTEKIQPLTRWGAALPERHLPDADKLPPAFIVICAEMLWAPNPAACQKEVGIAAQTILLAATEAGLGGLMIANFQAEALARALELPEHLVPQLVLAIGRPAEKVVLTEAEPGGSLNYYRDEQDVHYVPKRPLRDLLIN